MALDWKDQLAKIQARNPESTDPHAKLKQLVADVRHLDNECLLVLSSKQQDWLDDLLEHADNGAWGRFSANSIKFLETCVSGFYTQTELPKYEG